MNEAVAQLQTKIPGLRVKFSELSLSAEIVDSQRGALTAAAPGRAGFDIVRDFLRIAAPVYGIDASEVDSLHFIGESDSPSGLRMVRYEQLANGVPVFQSETRAILDRDGRLIRTLGLLVSGAGNAEPLEKLISPTQALVSAMGTVGIVLDASAMTFTNLDAAGTKAEVEANNPLIIGEASSKLVYFPIGPALLVPAWSQITFTAGNQDWYTIVDAKTGALLWRKNIRNDASTHEARFRVYVQADGKTPADSPAPHSPTTNTIGLGTQYAEIAPTIVSMLTAQDIVASPNGWINDCPGGGCTAAETQTIGNNVHAYLDRNNNNLPDVDAGGVLDGNGKPTGNPDANARNRDFLGTTPRDFQTNYLPPPQGGAANAEVGQTATGAGNNGTLAVDQFRRGVVTHLFYLTNWYHDQLFKLGFNEAAGNFQLTNFSGMGAGNDRVNAEAQDGGSTNNANFSTPPDGGAGRMQMYRFTGPTIDRDGSLDAEIVLHELTHGTSNRLIGNGSGLNWDIGGGMGEGWSDFYALSLLNNTNADNPNGLYSSGAYATFKLAGLPFTDNYVYGIRRFPYTTDNSINPMTWADVDQTTNNLSGGIAGTPISFNLNGAAEVHNSGEIWCLTLWEVRSRIIGDPAGANGDVPTGNNTMLQLITDGMKMTPISPSFLDARDAIIAADGATHAYANEESIWGGFADRGLGYNAVAPLAIMFTPVSPEVGILESFSVPFLDKGTVTFSDTPGGNNNGSIDPGEQLSLNVSLLNPWHKASKGVASATGTLTSPTAGVTIINGNSAYGPIAAQATVAGTPFVIRIASSVTCGQALDFEVTTSSSLGASTFSFRLRVGTPSGTGAPITYTRTESPGLTIQDNRPNGVISTQNITDDFEIADLNFRINSITHPFADDIVVGLKGPSGYGMTGIAFIGALVDNGFGGVNITNMVIDDQATTDMLEAPNSSAPYTASFQTVYNHPIWMALGFGPPDAVGQLSRFNGTKLKGDWKMVVSDQVAVGGGVFNGWSLIVTPVTFTCAPFVCPNPTITCPANITKSNDPNQCGAVVTYPAPTTSSPCSTPGAPQCSPASASFFPVGLTTVTCTVTDDLAHSSTCTFTVTVVDTQPPQIICPANIFTAATATCPISTVSGPVNFTVTASDNCPGVTILCKNQSNVVVTSGSTFPVGTTTVTCTATDASGNTATCSFTVNVFSFCLQDETNPNNFMLINAQTGDYVFNCGGVIVATGRGVLTRRECIGTLEDTKGDRRITAGWDTSANGNTGAGTAFLKIGPGGDIRCSITDKKMSNNTCSASATPPSAGKTKKL
ncbi:MAG: M36 family metallopeptidase [Blastocatellia bacterium]